jgi:signal transduction histidine kinase
MRDGGTLCVSARTENGRVEVRVRDSGHGIEAADLDRVFEPFFTTKPAGEGSGLGLAVVRSIVRDHGGEIDVESAPGRGTEFRISLPIAS